MKDKLRLFKAIRSYMDSETKQKWMKYLGVNEGILGEIQGEIWENRILKNKKYLKSKGLI